MRMKKVLSLVLAGTMVFSMAACGKKEEKKDSGKTSVSKTSSVTDDKKGSASSSVTSGDRTSGSASSGEETVKGNLKLALAETAYGTKMWDDVVAAFKEAYPEVEVDLTIDKKIVDVISPQMKANDFPDVILNSVGAEKSLTETFTKDNNLEELTDVLSMTNPGESMTVGEKILPGFATSTISQPYGDGKNYLMPMFYSPCGLFYNKGLFTANGWEVPKTWDEMWALGDKAKEKKIALFTYPTAGYFDAFLYALLHESMGQEEFAKAMSYGEGIWDSEGAKTSFDIIEKLATYTEKTTPANANNDNFQKNQQLILDNKALFMPNGTWVTGEMKDAPRAEGFEWGFTALPAVKEGGESASYTFFEQVWMPKGAENKEIGKKFIAFLYSDVAAEIFAKSNAIQPVKGISAKLEGENQLFYSIYDGGAVAVMDAFSTTDPVEGVDVRTTFLDPVNSLVNGELTKDKWVEQIKTNSDKLRAALKK